MSLDKPMVSVVVPTYNRREKIKEALTSIMRQSLSDVEILIVDDCSTDGTEKHLQRFVNRDPRFKILRTPENSNLPAIPRNVGIQQSRGRYVAFLDDDDVWFSFKLMRQVQALERYSALAMVHSRLIAKGNFEMLPSLMNLPCSARQKKENRNIERYNTVHMSSVCIRRSTLMSLGGFSEDPMLRAIEDYELWLRVYRSYEVGYLPEIHGRVFRSPDSTSARENMKSRQRYLTQLHELDDQPKTAVRRPGLSKIRCRLSGAVEHAVGLARVMASTQPRVIL